LMLCKFFLRKNVNALFHIGSVTVNAGIIIPILELIVYPAISIPEEKYCFSIDYYIITKIIMI
jgi:hypothetical protein